MEFPQTHRFQSKTRKRLKSRISNDEKISAAVYFYTHIYFYCCVISCRFFSYLQDLIHLITIDIKLCKSLIFRCLISRTKFNYGKCDNVSEDNATTFVEQELAHALCFFSCTFHSNFSYSLVHSNLERIRTSNSILFSLVGILSQFAIRK